MESTQRQTDELRNHVCPKCRQEGRLFRVSDPHQESGWKWLCATCQREMGNRDDTMVVGTPPAEGAVPTASSADTVPGSEPHTELEKLTRLRDGKLEEMSNYRASAKHAEQELAALEMEIQHLQTVSVTGSHHSPSTEHKSWVTELIAGRSAISVEELANVLLKRGFIKHRNKVHSVLKLQANELALDGYVLRKGLLAAARPIGVRSPDAAVEPCSPSPDAIPDHAMQSAGEESLYPWQKRALEAWQRAGHVGVVEAVTGTGKTRVALAALKQHVLQGWRVAVIVPSSVLQKQWSDIIGGMRLPARLGLLSGGKPGTLRDYGILVAVVNSAAKQEILPRGQRGLLIADECHHYGAREWSRVLQPGFERRLGLTATYERSDNGVRDYLNPYFGGPCYSLGYREALHDGVIADFRIAFLGVQFSGYEKHKYDLLDNQCKKLRWTLIRDYAIPGEPFGEFMARVQHMADQEDDDYIGAKLARQYLACFGERRDTLAVATGKIERLATLGEAVRNAERVMLFTQTKDAACRAVAKVKGLGIGAAVLDSSMPLDQRKGVFAEFEADGGEYKVLAAPLLLDEGVDVPSADLAIVVSASRTRRQMVQRMGRVLRKKPDGRQARIAVLFVEGTSEDPAQGAHETFIDLIQDVAKDKRTFDSSTPSHSICAYLREG